MNEMTDVNAFSEDDLNFDDLDLDQLDDDIEPAQNAASSPFIPFDDVPARDINFFKKIPVTVTLEVSSTEVSLGELMKAGEGSVIELDKLNGEPLDVKVNGSLMGHAEVVVVNDKYGLRLIDIVDSPLNSVES
ncbi:MULTISPECIES: flagellar motor switch protein FliN [Photobacterium]|uniref:Flagellar motor switch protein FliN n=1 Tax=Photobacterium halotolerans TaxID=265726 RepID=A0A0F5VEC6_9GAMM|nr:MULTISPECIES: flagellar motor switch protein FliN [Photobacterium]KKC99839.1 flagellar motor switch protein FliN [Photobacterium halotolerans]UIP29467.1 flagellar motor switch protein FliN [Photobacterium sp. TLY01]